MPAPLPQEAVTVSVFAQRFSATRRGARLARRLAVHRLDCWGMPYGSPVSEAVALVVAELAANAVLHGRVAGRDFELVLRWDRLAAVVRVEVSDTHPDRPKPVPPEPASGITDAEGGRGLLLVAAVGTRWGVADRDGPGKTVWAECGIKPVPAAAGDRHGMPHYEVAPDVDPLATLLAGRDADDRRSWLIQVDPDRPPTVETRQ